MGKESKKKNLYALSSKQLSENKIEQAWKKFDGGLNDRKRNFLGFQANQGLHYKDLLANYLDFQINNLGDPYEEGSFRINSKEIEQAVLAYYAELWHGKPYAKTNPESCWGYVCSMGSTEANLYGLWNARDYLAGKPLLNPTEEQEVSLQEGSESEKARTPLLFYSQDTHYSIVKSACMLGLKRFFEVGNKDYPRQCELSRCEKCRVNEEYRRQCKLPDCGEWPTTGVPSVGDLEGTGSIDVDKLKYLVGFFAAEGYPILINFNYGTAFKGAYDNIEAAGNELMPIFQKHRLVKRRVHYDRKDKKGEDRKYVDSRNGFWFHVDGALGAAYMPFIERAYGKGLYKGSEPFPRFDFGLKYKRLKYVHSISMSGHKWIGAPWPGAIYMTKRKYQLDPPSHPAYIGTPDSTLAGSRNGHSALILWNYLATTSHDDEMTKARKTEQIASYAYDRLKNLEEELKAKHDLDEEGMWLGRSHLSLSVYFKQVHNDIVEKYSLNREQFEVKFGDGKREKTYNHIFAMAHVDEKIIERFIEDLRSKDGAFLRQKR